MARVRLLDIAERAGVSVATVSKILKGPPLRDLFRPECVESVHKAAKALGYKPNYLARALQTGRSGALGMAVGSPSQEELADDRAPAEFWSHMISGVDRQARVMGYHFVAIGNEEPFNVVDNSLRFLDESRIDALVMQGHTYRGLGRKKMAGCTSPVVLTCVDGDTEFPVVDVDDGAGIVAAVEHLAELQHRNLLWVGGTGPHDQRRKRFFRSAAKKAGLRTGVLDVPPLPAVNHQEHWEERYGRQVEVTCSAFVERFGEKCPHTGVVCYNECFALGIYAACIEVGLRIPRDLSVIGFDNLHAATVYPQMTVASHMLHQIGQRAAQIAIEMTSGEKAWKKYRGYRECIPSKLVVRKSTAPAKP